MVRQHRSTVVELPINVPHLADTSAWAKARNDPALAADFENAARRGLIVTCDVIALELLRSAQNYARFERQDGMLANLESCPIGAAELQRAREVQAALASDGVHRGVKLVDLLVAAAAEAASLPVLHYDHDFDLIATVTDQPVPWIAERVSLA